MSALPFWGEQPKIKLDLLSAKTTLCGFPVLILVLERSREEHTEVFMGPGVFQGWHEPVPMTSLSDPFSWETPGSSSAVPVWMWLCSCGLTDSARCATPHCLRPEWGGIFALCVPSSLSLFSCQETPGCLLESLTGSRPVRFCRCPGMHGDSGK